ncbi:hypothetical protein EDM53_01595 [Rickettsiales endosymbiont of Peranema trichophorum]|uniref:TraK domain-containing protein n=1 Tax=Rickettsiales endosymbiont of Peranema trichophorum TaxID=2486577 RepID=UPI0010239734|nr:type-F conjugative transfer system secretin TraK [Rickettsiales endosymbiont of Peranema trichophorum]RZI47502.1 hypothetical protein EDM53_01595 [Rickettsiales endosymbiont of Peranema trichophorum]
MNEKYLVALGIFLFIVICDSIALASTQEYQLNETRRIHGYIGRSESNRIKVEGDRIVEVIGLDDDFALESDSKLGQIFIKPMVDSATKATFTVITERGKTQDFSLVIKPSIDGQVILLKSDVSIDVGYIGNKHGVHDEIISIIKVGLDYKSDAKQKAYIENGLEMLLLTQRRIRHHTLEVWTIKNVDDKSVMLAEKSFVKNEKVLGQMSPIAIMIEDRHLEPNQTTRLYKVRYNGK